MDKSSAVWAREITQSFGGVVVIEGASGRAHGPAGLNGAGFVDGPEVHTAFTARQNLSALAFLRGPSTSSTSPRMGGTSPTETDRRR